MKTYNYFITWLIFLFFIILNSSIYAQIVQPYSLIPIKNDTTRIELNKTIKGKFSFFSERLASNWEDWSWESECDFNFKSKDYAYNGDYAIEVILYKYGGLAIGSNDGLRTTGFTNLGFFINGGAKGGQKIKVYVNVSKEDGKGKQVSLTDRLTANRWNFISIPLKNLNAENTIIYKINISDTSGNDKSPSFYVDDIMLFK